MSEGPGSRHEGEQQLEEPYASTLAPRKKMSATSSAPQLQRVSEVGPLPSTPPSMQGSERGGERRSTDKVGRLSSPPLTLTHSRTRSRSASPALPQPQPQAQPQPLAHPRTCAHALHLACAGRLALRGGKQRRCPADSEPCVATALRQGAQEEATAGGQNAPGIALRTDRRLSRAAGGHSN